MAVRTKQLGSGNTITTSGLILYTTPTGRVTIVKSLVIQNGASTAQRVVVAVINGGTTKCAWVYNVAAAGSAAESIRDLPYVVLAAGDQLKVTPLTGNCSAIASGAELVL